MPLTADPSLVYKLMIVWAAGAVLCFGIDWLLGRRKKK